MGAIDIVFITDLIISLSSLGRMMNVIVVGQGKGGTGKTTLAVNVADHVARQGRAATLIDADPQGGALAWAAHRRLSVPVHHSPVNAHNHLVWVRDALKTGGDLAVVDLPGGFGPSFSVAVLIADLLVVPCGPSNLDVAAADRTIARARELRGTDPTAAKLKVVTVPVRVDDKHLEGLQMAETLAKLGEAVAPTLSYDAAFARSVTRGTAVSALDGGGRAALEVAQLAAFLMRQITPQRDSLLLRRLRLGAV